MQYSGIILVGLVAFLLIGHKKKVKKEVSQMQDVSYVQFKPTVNTIKQEEIDFNNWPEDINKDNLFYFNIQLNESKTTKSGKFLNKKVVKYFFDKRNF